MSDKKPGDEPCPRCGERVGDHTVDLLGEHLGDLYNHHLPYEETAEPVDQQVSMLRAGSIDLRAGVQQTAIGSFPVLVFDFAGPDGVIPPIGLLLDEAGMRNVRLLVGQAIDGAIKAARRNRGRH